MAVRQVKKQTPKDPRNKFFLGPFTFGKVDGDGKLVYSVQYKKVIASPDRPLMMFAGLLDNVVIPKLGYSTEEAATGDLDKFITWANGIEAVNPKGKVNSLLSDAAKALTAMLKAHDELIPGIGHIACKDYQVVNEAPILARAVLKRMEEEAAKEGQAI